MASSSKFPVLNIVLLVAAVGVLLVALKISNNKPQKPISALPFYGPRLYNSITKDTDFHTVLNFNLQDQMGQTLTLDSFKNKIFVANFFYATCPGICKKMNFELERATKQFANDPKVKFVSYSVDPRRDSVPVLADYAKLHDAIPYQWYFLTGNRDSIYHLAWKSYFAAVDTGDGKNFVHTENMTLVDMNHHIRGFYHGTDSADVAHMISDIKVLLKESN
jgi:protein SCO1/2